MVSLAISQSTLQSWLVPERIARLAKLANILLVVWLAWLLAELSWLLIPGAEETMDVPVELAPGPVTPQRPRIDERQIASWHLFGIAGEEKPAPRPKQVDAPETRLKLTLRGVFASDDNTSARAIVGDPKGKEDSYAVGDPLPGGAKLSEIYPDRIILERNGRFETLRLPRELSKAGAPSVSHKSATRIRSTGSASKAAAFQKYRKEIKQNPSAFMNYVRATPYRQKGKFVGFRLQAGRQRGALKELGLQAGDIVTAINGVQIDSPAKGMKAMQALGEGDTVDVRLLRGGQETSMSLTLPSSGR